MTLPSSIRSIITGCGAYLPKKILTNADLVKMVDTSDEWIVERTGITQRHIAADGEMTSDMAMGAACQAMQHAGVTADMIDLVILATTTPDSTFPSTATKVQSQLGIKRGAAFDIQAVCSGFVYALAIADNFIKCGQVKRALVIGADTMSRIIDWEDRGTCILFGDGAGAVVVEAAAQEDNSDRGILSTHLYADGDYGNLLYVDGGASSTGTVGKIRMLGQEVFKHAVQKMADSVLHALDANDLTVDDINILIPHQANIRILSAVARKLGIPHEKVVITVQDHANTSAASIPLAMQHAVSAGRIKKGDIVVIEALGGGLTWGAAVIRW